MGMTLRTALCVGAVLLASLSGQEGQAGDRVYVRAKESANPRLSPELDLVRKTKCHYLGTCRRGRPIFDVPAGEQARVQSMSMSMKANAPQVQPRGSRLLIRYASLDQKPQPSTLSAAGLKTVEDYERGAFLIVQPDAAVSAEGVEALLADEAVVHAAPDYVVTAHPTRKVSIQQGPATSATPNDPGFSQLWGMKNIGAVQVWPTAREATSVIVAVIDTGVDYNHPDLKANMWSKNGRHGFDFYDDDDDPMDEQDHGTHCAGTIAGVGNNGAGVVGVCWKARIMAMRFLGPDGSGATSDAVKCIDWAVANGAHVLSNSWSGPDTSLELVEAISRAEKKGVLFVAAAGNTEGRRNNDTSPYYPAAHNHSNIITVAAIDQNNAASSFTHFGRSSVDIGAPGVGILSTVRNGEYAAQDGTSMATPHVAGAAALIWTKTFPNPFQDKTQMTTVRDLIYANARPVPALRDMWGHSQPARVPGGVLDISFLAEASTTNPQPPIQGPNGRRTIVENRAKVDPRLLR